MVNLCYLLHTVESVIEIRKRKEEELRALIHERQIEMERYCVPALDHSVLSFDVLYRLCLYFSV